VLDFLPYGFNLFLEGGSVCNESFKQKNLKNLKKRKRKKTNVLGFDSSDL
jgi:hypothetical protein